MLDTNLETCCRLASISLGKLLAIKKRKNVALRERLMVSRMLVKAVTDVKSNVGKAAVVDSGRRDHQSQPELGLQQHPSLSSRTLTNGRSEVERNVVPSANCTVLHPSSRYMLIGSGNAGVGGPEERANVANCAFVANSTSVATTMKTHDTNSGTMTHVTPMTHVTSMTHVTLSLPWKCTEEQRQISHKIRQPLLPVFVENDSL